MDFLIITGMSGAGKSKAATSLEDLGFYCVDNMPAELIPKFAEICMTAKYSKVALVMDVRTALDFDKMFASIEEAKQLGCGFKIIFLDAKNQVLMNRFKETRRKHPMDDGSKGLLNSIAHERELLEPLRMKSNFEIDTSTLNTSRLRDHMVKLFLGNKQKTLIINVVTFGFKHGAALEADLMFDVRFLPNPYYEKDLRAKTGIEQDVREFVFQNGVAEQFMVKLRDMVDFLIPNYIDEGKTSLVIAIGCTGGKHRSVAIGEEILKHVIKEGYNAVINHRDFGKK